MAILTSPPNFVGVKTVEEMGDQQTIEEMQFVGYVPNTTCITDPRFCYALFIPTNYFDLSSIPLLVLVHGSGRNNSSLRTVFKDFAVKHNVALLAPLFPRGVVDPNEADDYKAILSSGIRYDELVLAMIEEVKWKYSKITIDRVLMHGFSGGGQFVHRFTYLHPNRLLAAVIGAPGHITVLDNDADFPIGIRDFKERFGITVDIEAIKQVPLLLLVGSEDTSIDHVLARKGRPVIGDRRKILNRQEDLRRLQDSLLAVKHPNVNFTIVQDVGHDWRKVGGVSSSFLERYLMV